MTRVAVAAAAFTGAATVTALIAGLATVAWRAWTIHTAHTALGHYDTQEVDG